MAEKSGKKYWLALQEGLRHEMERDPNVFVAGIDIAAGGIFSTTKGFVDLFGPQRVLSTPIAESAITGLALGAAACGLRPVVEVQVIDFMCVCVDVIVNQMAKMKYMFGGKARLPIVVLTSDGGGRQMGAQHSQCLEVWYTHIPGLKVVMPSGPYDGKGLLISAIRDDNPVLFISNKRTLGFRGEVPDGPYTVPLGKAEVKREGTDVTVVATGALVQDALEAAQELAQRGVSVEVVDPRTLSPLDSDTILASVRKTHRAVVAHEAVKFCGYGAEIAAQIVDAAFDDLDAPVKRIGAPFSPVPFNPGLERVWMPGKPQITAAIEEIVPQAVRV